MSGVSNFFRRRDASVFPGQAVRCPSEQMDSALRLLLGQNGEPADLPAVREFAKYAYANSIDLRHLYVHLHDDCVSAAVLAIPGAGRTALLLINPCGRSRGTAAAAGACVELATSGMNDVNGRPCQFFQTLLDPAELRLAETLQTIRFEKVAALNYLLRRLTGNVAAPDLPIDCELLTYSPATHGMFSEVILQTYENSLDCPRLHGRRHITDIIDGHRATGEHDPGLWFCLVKNERPIGVLLLSPIGDRKTIEMVYIGVTSNSRGTGVGDYLVRLAIAVADEQSADALTLAVDEDNDFALRLYYRHGFGEVNQRIAMMKEASPEQLGVSG